MIMDRDKSIDILKGIGIILMVIGHTQGPFTHFIYLFHMAIFFIASGYCYNHKYSTSIQSIWTLIRKRIKSLWLPYFCWNAFYLLLNNLLIKINFYTTNERFLEMSTGNQYGLATVYTKTELVHCLFQCFCFNKSTQFGGVSWFLEVLFFVTILFTIVDYIALQLRNRIFIKVAHFSVKAYMSIAIVLLGIGFYLHIIDRLSFLHINTICSVFILYALGVFFHDMRFKFNQGRLLIVCSSFIILLIANQLGSIELVVNNYTNPIFLLIVSIAGWFMVLGISQYISYTNKLSNALTYLGENTITIMYLHFLMFKIITIVQVMVYHKQQYMIASFPVMYNHGIWWFIYAIWGLTTSVILCISYKKLKIVLKRKVSSFKVNYKQNSF